MTPSSARFIGRAVIGVVVIALLLLLNPFIQVSAGERAVVTHFGAVSGELGPGVHWLTPIATNVTIMNVQTQKEQTTAGAASKDLQQVSTEIAVNYNVDPNKVSDLYTKVGASYKGTIIDPAIQEVVKQVTANYTAEELITKRTQVTTDIETALKEKLAPSDIIVTAVNVTNFDFSAQFNSAVESKVTAQQNAQAAQNKLAQVQAEAQQTIAKATADAKAIQIQAQAINSQGGADYVALQAIGKWDGHYPATYLGSQSSLPIINIK